MENEYAEITKNGKKKTIEIIKKLSKRWFIDAFSGMAGGLFATLIAGTIVVQIGTLIAKSSSTTWTDIGNFIVYIGKIAQYMMGAGIGVGIAYTLKADKLTIFTCAVAGALGAYGNGFTTTPIAVGIGNPIGAYLGALFACEICMLIAGKTKIDIIAIPLTGVIVATIVVLLLCKPVNFVISKLAEGIATSMEWNPVIMGIIVAVVMGLLLTLPTSSAAIWVSIAVSNPDSPYLLLAGGAAVVGCAAHMVGFAVASFRENKWSGLIAQGIGTSMLQIPNLMKNPRILIPAVVSSAIVGPLSSAVFKLKCNATGGGMGTAGLVGVFGTIEASGDIATWTLVLGIILLFFVIPAVVSFFVSELLRKIGWIKPGDMKLSL